MPCLIRFMLLLPVLLTGLTSAVAAQQVPGRMGAQQGKSNLYEKICGRAYRNEKELEHLRVLEAAGKCGDGILPNGWSKSGGPEREIYTFTSNAAMILFGPVDPVKASDPRQAARDMDKPEGCVGISSAPVTAISGGHGSMVQTRTATLSCTVMTGVSAGRGYLLIAMEQPAAKAQAGAFALSIFNRAMGSQAASAPGAAMHRPASAPKATAALPAAAHPAVIDAALKKAIASVPPANRPIAMPTRQEVMMSGGFPYTTYRPWMVFANGYATDSSCYDWDPRLLAPTPQSLGVAGKKCDVVRWRKSGTKYQFQDENGRWEEDDTGAILYPFTTGLRLDRTLENQGGADSVPITGMVSVNTVFQGGLRLTSTGFMQSEWSNQTVVSGGGVGGGSGGSGKNFAGRYHADGYLIAVADPQGVIKIGFIGGSNDEGQRRYHYLYLNGQQYWPPDP
jgi:hypothetical protein